MAPSANKTLLTPATATPAESVGGGEDATTIRGPHPGYVAIAEQYTTEQQLRRMLKDNGCDSVGEDRFRLLGVQLIDNVRESLQLPVRTFDTACTYYHKFRLNFRDAEYNYQDAALAALFVACKVEDTIKKSKEILCAAYNLKNADHTTTQDDKMFEQPSKIIIGLERLILETVGFDFRGRYPQKLLVKVVKKLLGSDDSKRFYDIAYDMCTDLYKTFAVIKQTTFTMVLSIVELTSLISGLHIDKATKLEPESWHTTRKAILETMLDLLDLYTQHPKSTKIGTQFDINKFIEVKISINGEVDSTPSLSRFPDWCDRCEVEDHSNAITPGSATSPTTTNSFPGNYSVKRNARNQDGTLRFVFDSDLARHEQGVVGEYFREEYEEYEIEVEEPIPEPEHRHRDRGHGHGHGHGHGRGRDSGWGAHPPHRPRNHHHDRKGRRGYY